jgi:hypothetical protein
MYVAKRLQASRQMMRPVEGCDKDRNRNIHGESLFYLYSASVKSIPQKNDNILVTHFNSDYSIRGLAMISSLRKNGFGAPILVVAHDIETKEYVRQMNFSEVEVISLSELEYAYPQLMAAKNDRSIIEYFYCLSPFAINYVFDNFSAKRVIYLDADLYFFSSPESLINTSSDVNVVIVSHNYPERFNHLQVYGKFNVGWLQFSRTKTGLDALKWWTDACLVSTNSKLSSKVYGDQKYLDEFESRFSGTAIRRNLGENLAPWNLFGKSLQTVNATTIVNDLPLYYFHFSGIRFLRFSVILGTSHYSYRNKASWKKAIFDVYLLEVLNVCSKIQRESPRDTAYTPLKLKIKALIFSDIRFYPFKKNYLKLQSS